MASKSKIARKPDKRTYRCNTGEFDDYLSLEGMPVGSVTTLNREIIFSTWVIPAGSTVKATAVSTKGGTKGGPDETETIREYLDVDTNEFNDPEGTELNVNLFTIRRRTSRMSRVPNPETKALDTVWETENHY